MQSITVFNNKGGVGKTTFLCNLASYLCTELSQRVLVVDADPQCNATVYMLPENEVLELYDSRVDSTIDAFLDPLRRGKGYVDKAIEPRTTPRFGVDLLPGDPRLALSEDILASDWVSAQGGSPRGLQTTFVFKDLLARYEDDYDYVFVDVGPSLGALNRSVLIGSDYFVVPMSSDVFSLLAIRNISTSLSNWKRLLDKGLESHEQTEGVPYELDSADAHWELLFAGYVTQQYTSKTKQGKREPVKAYEKIIKRMPSEISRELEARFAKPNMPRTLLGEIPNLHSVVPMSQTVHAPIFQLKKADGVVGAHFAKVADAKSIYMGIANALLANLSS